MKYILWCITGAGAYIRDITGVFSRVKDEYMVKITIAFSKWGFEIARLYGILRSLREISSGGYMEEWLIGDNGFYFVGRINMHKYDLVVIAPATSNSIAKMVYGIADTLPTLIFAEAGKSGIPVIVFPSDTPSSNGLMVSEAPCYVDRGLCKYSVEEAFCQASQYCPVDAIMIYDGKPRIDYSKCIGCGICVNYCPYNAIKCWEKITLKPRPLDLENIKKLSLFENVYVVGSVEQLYDTIKKLLR